MRVVVVAAFAVLCSVSAALAQSGTLSAAEIRAAFVGKKLESRIAVGIVRMTYGPDGRYLYEAGKDFSTVFSQGKYEIADGKICHTSDDRTKGVNCQTITKEGARYYFTAPDGTKRPVNIL